MHKVKVVRSGRSQEEASGGDSGIGHLLGALGPQDRV